ncbi:MAG: hypothetical protein C5B53_04705 [Candidatus Melainabacteria bacterium]|nr:MAG: hypothetical protein C5B53_04705 [Candidatus Melainabacteria bacterium]
MIDITTVEFLTKPTVGPMRFTRMILQPLIMSSTKLFPVPTSVMIVVMSLEPIIFIGSGRRVYSNDCQRDRGR